jgi:hypothetical protein
MASQLTEFFPTQSTWKGIGLAVLAEERLKFHQHLKEGNYEKKVLFHCVFLLNV